MPLPKSVTKITKDGVTFTSNVNRVEYTIEELSRAALKDVGKFLRRQAKANAPFRTGALRKNIGTWVKKKKDSGIPVLQIGLYNKKRAEAKKLRYAFYGTWQELGSSKRKAANGGRGFIRPAIEDNIDQIRIIEGQYLAEIEDENRILGLIDEEEEISDDD